MNQDGLGEPLKTLRIAFYCYIGSWVVALGPGAIVGAGETHTPAWANLLGILGVIGLVGSALTYLVSLGRLAHRLEKSAITWVGLTMLFSPISYLIAYPSIKGHAVEAMKARDSAAPGASE
jgi:hypothetical protein